MVTAGQRSITRLELEIWELSHNQFSQRITGLLWYQVYVVYPILNQVAHWISSQVRKQVQDQVWHRVSNPVWDQATEDTNGSKYSD